LLGEVTALLLAAAAEQCICCNACCKHPSSFQQVQWHFSSKPNHVDRYLPADCNVVASWGRGEDGQLGHGDAEQVNAPKAVHALLGADVSAVCCGAEYTVAVSKQHRRVYSWGW
jgi:alpha-tubulin suppressor-like RCC1 family protein